MLFVSNNEVLSNCDKLDQLSPLTEEVEGLYHMKYEKE